MAANTGCIRFFFDAGSDVCLWACNEATKARHGYAIDADDLPLSTNTRYWLHHLMAWYDTSLDWDNPGGASPWSDDEQARFRLAAQEGLARLRQELTPAGYEIRDESDQMPEPVKLRARIFMPAADAAQANDHDQALRAALAAFLPYPINAPEPYWKIPGWYEHYFELTPANLAAFDAIVALSDGDWDVSRGCECEAVWTQTPGHSFLLPGVTWAHILLIYLNPPQPDMDFLPQSHPQ